MEKIKLPHNINPTNISKENYITLYYNILLAWELPYKNKTTGGFDIRAEF